MVTLIFLRGLCRYVWVRVVWVGLTYSLYYPRGLRAHGEVIIAAHYLQVSKHEHMEEVIIAAHYLQVSKHEHMEEVIIAAHYLQVSKHEHMEEVIIAAHYLQVSKHEHMEEVIIAADDLRVKHIQVLTGRSVA